MTKFGQKIWGPWNLFWFSPVGLLNLAFFRIVLCLTMGTLYLDRLFDWRIFYTNEGILPRSMALQVIPEFFRPSFAWFFWSDQYAFLFHLLLVLGLFLLAFGVGGRILNFIVWILHIGFLQRNFSIAFGADLIGGIFLLYLGFTQSCARLSLWSFFSKSKQTLETTLSTRAFYRMIQVQLCIIYAYTGFEKLKGFTWWDGTALWSVVANPQMVIADFSWLRHFPLVIAALTFGTILFEIYFPVLVWNSKTRPLVLLIGVLFHSGIGVMLALYSFALIMLAPYLLFIAEGSLSQVLQWTQSRLNMRHKNEVNLSS